MSFRFDARAALSEIQNQGRHHAIAAIPAIALPRLAAGSETIATIATIAGHGPKIRVRPDGETFAERAAIAEHDGGLRRAEAEALAAQAQGFEDADALFAAITGHWLVNLPGLAERVRDPAGTRYIAAAGAFTAEGWAGKALALGWSELGLFGLCPSAPWTRLDRMGAAWLGPPKAITGESITYVTGNRLLRGQQAPGCVLSVTHSPGIAAAAAFDPRGRNGDNEEGGR